MSLQHRSPPLESELQVDWAVEGVVRVAMARATAVRMLQVNFIFDVVVSILNLAGRISSFWIFFLIFERIRAFRFSGQVEKVEWS